MKSERKRTATSDESIAKKPKTETITAEEAKLYDRQIRLWGMQAQARMRNAKMLIVGCTGLTNEVLKNLVLAGIGSITIHDDEIVTERCLGAQFLIDSGDIDSIIPRLSNLNPRVNLKASSSELNTDFLVNFDIVCCIRQPPAELRRIDDICVEKGIAFWASDVIGFRGYIFCNLQEHEYMIEKRIEIPGKDAEIQQIPQIASYTPFSTLITTKKGMSNLEGAKLRKYKKRANPLGFALIALWSEWMNGKFPSSQSLLKAKDSIFKKLEIDADYVPDSLIRQVVEQYGKEASPTCAILGGFLAQEIIKLLSKKECPFNKLFCLDSFDVAGVVM